MRALSGRERANLVEAEKLKEYEVSFVVGFTLHKIFLDARNEAEAETEFWRRFRGERATVIKVKEVR